MGKGFRNIMLFVLVMHGMACAAQPAVEDVVYAGCTPGEGQVKQMLGITDNKVVDFIRWNLVLQGNQQFVLDISYGESRPNTLALKADSIHRTIIGTYKTNIHPGNATFREVVELQGSEGNVHVTMARVTANLFHLLTAEQALMVGNGGWSFQLNRRSPIPVEDLFIRSGAVDDTSTRMVFDGRTPCQQISAEHPEMNTSSACFKLKWQLILERDPLTKQPTGYTFRKVIDNTPRQVTGRWIQQKGTGALSGSVIYTLDPENPATAMSFLVGDDQVLIFLDKQMKPYPGNEHFSVALNRRKM